MENIIKTVYRLGFSGVYIDMDNFLPLLKHSYSIEQVLAFYLQKNTEEKESGKLFSFLFKIYRLILKDDCAIL